MASPVQAAGGRAPQAKGGVPGRTPLADVPKELRSLDKYKYIARRIAKEELGRVDWNKPGSRTTGRAGRAPALSDQLQPQATSARRNSASTYEVKRVIVRVF